jgi:glycosyltransferase involved in cell wall biosynthesis
MAVVTNEPVRRWRVTGTDLLAGFSAIAPVDVFGMAAGGTATALGVDPAAVVAAGDLPTEPLHAEMARRRLYLHPVRWTSLGLSLLEAMHLGMPVVALATTEVAQAVPRLAGAVSTNLDELHRAARDLLADPDAAREAGRIARAVALARFGLGRFLADWDTVLASWTAGVRPQVEARA